jgi:hypothetical protein
MSDTQSLLQGLKNPNSFDVYKTQKSTVAPTTLISSYTECLGQKIYGNKRDAGAFLANTTITDAFPRESKQGLSFYTFYHPFAPLFIKKLNQEGVNDLLASNVAEYSKDPHPIIDSSTKMLANDGGTAFDDFQPDFDYIQEFSKPSPHTYSNPQNNYYLENVDFSEYGTYSGYNWELFFHAPFLIATRLSKNGHYAEAREWFHTIFDPTEKPDSKDPTSNAPFWKVLPFKSTQTHDIVTYLEGLKPGYDKDPLSPTNSQNNQMIDQGRADPFNAFLIARNRPVAFMKNVVMRYLDNLIAWGDDLFRTYTRENINEATQLYVMASHLLGPKPPFVPTSGTIQPKSYNDLVGSLDDIGDALVAHENSFPNSSEIQHVCSSTPQSLLGVGQSLYFCVPPNDTLLQYWSTVADRLFKIRHGQNIMGVVKPLALFEPPIDPALLIKAHAEGLDIAGILADLESPAPMYRFSYLLQKAKEFCGEVVSLGSAVLSACEKRDAEDLSKLRQTQEIDMLNRVTEVKTRQVVEARANKDALQSSRTTAIQKLQHYTIELLNMGGPTIPDVIPLPDELDANSNLSAETAIAPVPTTPDFAPIDDGGVKMIAKEKQEIDFNETAKWLQVAGNGLETLAGIFRFLPDINILSSPWGVGGSTNVTGGQSISEAFSANSRAFSGNSSFYSAEANSSYKMSLHIRRQQDWVFQANMTVREIIQIDKQIMAAQIRQQMAEHELNNHLQQITNAQDIEQFLETKFSNQELYQWMIDKLQDIHKQGYQLAYDMARKAEKAYRFELGLQDSNFIQYGYYEDSYLGITAGEQLQLALKQLDAAYIENNVREFELTKHISLISLDPAALLQLIETGSCQFDIPEEWWDMDYPGHYFRRIKSVGISIPCIAGPYTTVNSTLRLQKNSIRFNSSIPNKYPKDANSNDPRFMENNIPFTAIATSSAQNDSGTFELNFRDERYLPFEGAGVISTWQLELNGKFVQDDFSVVDLSQFDYSTISDVIMHVRYTSREDAGDFRQKAIENLGEYKGKSNFMRLFRPKYDFPNEFYAFTQAPVPGGQQILNLTLDKSRFPFFATNGNIHVNRIEFFADTDGKSNISFSLDAPNGPSVPLSNDTDFGSLVHGIADYTNPLTIVPSVGKILQIKADQQQLLASDNLKDLYVLIHYSLIPILP